MARLFDLPAEWRLRCANVSEAVLPGGHLFIFQFPEATARGLEEFFAAHAQR